MTEPTPSNDEPKELPSGSMEEQFVADGVRRILDSMWMPEDPEVQEYLESERLAREAGIATPAVDLDIICQEIEKVAEARDAIDKIFDEMDDSTS